MALTRPSKNKIRTLIYFNKSHTMLAFPLKGRIATGTPRSLTLREPVYDIFVLQFWRKKQQFSVALPTP